MKPVFLTGYRGSGKSTVGRLLSQRLNWDFCDLDRYLCSAHKKTIAEIVEESGWDSFRQLESEALQNAGLKFGPSTVFATGGGAVLSALNRSHMLQTGTVIWLDVPVKIIHARLARRPDLANRPGLTDKTLEDEIAAVLAERLPFYRECHHQIDATDAPEVVCARILQALGHAG